MNNDNFEYILYLKDCKSIAKPIYVDFTEYNKNSNELIKACGINNKNKINILDCTAGLARDSFIMANNNCNVISIEKNKIIFALLKDGFERGEKNINISKILNKITLLNCDSIDFLTNTKQLFDCIYLDPMFEDIKKSRLVKKEMQLFHNLLNNEKCDNCTLFNLAIKNAINRVVVKRYIHGDFIVNNIKPSFQIKGKTIRYDVYLKDNIKYII